MTLQLAMGNGSVWFLGRAGSSVEAVSKLRRDELHESPIVRKSPKKSRTRVTRPSELKVLRRSRSVRAAFVVDQSRRARSDAPYQCRQVQGFNTRTPFQGNLSLWGEGEREYQLDSYGFR